MRVLYSCTRIHAAFLVLIAVQANAQETEAIDEVVVTGDYRGRTVDDLPTAVSIVNASEISDKAAQHFEELIESLPNLNWSGDGHRAKYLQIRGVGELAQYQGAPNPSVGFLVDDMDFSGIGGIATLFDIDQIEVFRGPQGTRYGANALAGLVYMQSTDPGDTFSGRVSVTAADDDALGAGLAVGGPIGETVGLRFSAQHYESNGFRRNPYLGRDDTNGRNETTLRGRLKWSAGDNWDFRLTGMLVDVDNGYDAFAIDNSLTVLSDNPGKDAQESRGLSFNIDWDGSSKYRVTSVTSVVDSDIDFSFDADWGNDDAWRPVLYDFTSQNNRERKSLNREVRVLSKDAGRLFNGTTDWLFGLYLNKLEEDLETVNVGEYFDPGFNFADSLDDRLDSQFEAISMAVFGQLSVTVGDAGKLSLGLRAEQRDVDYADSTGLSLSPEENMIGGELSYSHRFSRELSAFATVSRGYKAGGFNLGFVPAGRREFAEESMWNFEIGARATFAGGRIALGGAIFYAIRDDQQVETSFQIDPNDPASFVFFTDNAAEGKTLGAEASVTWQVNDSLELFGNVGLLNAEFEDFETPQVSISGRDQAHAPAYTMALGGVYRHNSGFFGRFDFAAKDDFFFDVAHDQKSEPYTLTHLRAGYEAESWIVQLWIRNAFDERYAVRGFYFGNEPPNFPTALFIRQGDPRQVGITFDKRF